MKGFLRNLLYHLLSSQCLILKSISFFFWIPASCAGMTPKEYCHSNSSCTKILLILLLVLFPLLALPIGAGGAKESCDYEYYPKLDHHSADELCTIKRNYYRYGKELKMLADNRIKEIIEIVSSANNKAGDL
ncbi:hypothetical protein [Wolbachia endosymbiont of Ctenocephalides felis wCfeJ]|uniref:hypothetical protein n=1 Tax=Wolbachia endosymbiont of Ctenocephalides felis wCfeJ TaxID=2732594 RepID=UPI0014456265|nr:hypothetical protein [Wolbachia endosymbiont of Ctenocephalides felis wCfeJ]WCR58090.1 MAG: hypothetical protein PG980_000562 [Wolbachia endosymbiont of Ctenocephalides felis wCfeJ]